MYAEHFSNIKTTKQDKHGWFIGFCPFHQDKTPSFSYDPETGRWVCFAGCGKGDIYNYIMKRDNCDFKAAKKLLKGKEPKRKVTARYFYVDEAGNHKYLKERIEPGKKGKTKDFNFKCKTEENKFVFGRGGNSLLYRLNEIAKNSTIFITEGEGKADLLASWGLCATCLDAGVQSKWMARHIKALQDKHIVILPDNDEPGKEYANKLVGLLFEKVLSVKLVSLPGLKDKWDVVDWAQIKGNDKKSLLKIVEKTPIIKELQPTIKLDCFTKLDTDKYVDKYVECDLTILGETSESYHATESFKVTHCKSLESNKCTNCVDTIVLEKGSQEFIGSCMSSNTQITGMLRQYCCDYGARPSVEILTKVTVKELFAHQVAKTGEELVEKKIYYLSSEPVKPGNYKAWGWVKTHPKNQSITFLVDRLEHQEEDYINYTVQPDLLLKFQELSILDILRDISENVTQIYQRDEITMTTLLVYFSPLQFVFNSTLIRGWLLACIIGDSGLGKTQTYRRIAEYIGVGDFFSCLTGSRTGLTYAMVEHQTKGWQIKIGKYPANTRKILAVDETQYLNEDDLQTLSKAMDEGFLQIDRVKSKGYESMTRLLMLCNPKRDVIMDAYMFGCETLKSIFRPTILRRLDFVTFANAADIKDLGFLNQEASPHSGRISAQMLKNAIFFVWKLKPENINFLATRVCLKAAEALSKKYGAAVDIPLVPPSDFRNTLARLSAAIACLDMSLNDNGDGIDVLPQHVNIAVDFLETVYGHENCQLGEYAEIQRLQNELVDYDDIKERFVNKKASQTPEEYFTRAIWNFRINAYLRRDDLVDALSCSLDTVKRIVSFLKKYNLIITTKAGYKKQPKFIKFLRRFLKEKPGFFDKRSWEENDGSRQDEDD